LLALFLTPQLSATESPKINSIVRSVSVSGDDCSVTVKGDDGTLYYADAYASACRPIATGDRLVGEVRSTWFPFGNPSRLVQLYIEAGLSKKGKMTWHVFTVTTQYR
jgi:hypothetical protein